MKNIGQPSSSGDLIVNFPSGPRRSAAPLQQGIAQSTALSQGTKKSSRRAVTFNETSEVVIIAADKAAAKAYSREDIARFKASLATDVRRLRRDLALPPADGELHIYNWVGLERYTTPAVLQRSLDSRRDHPKTVLRAQKILKEDGGRLISNEARVEALSRTSRRSSRWARARATRLASAFSTFQESS